MKLFQVVITESMEYEYSNESIVFNSLDLNKAISYAKSIFVDNMISRDIEDLRFFQIHSLIGYFGNLFPKSNIDNYDFKSIKIIETHLDQPLTNKNVVWEFDSKDVFNYFSDSLDLFLKQENIPSLSIEEKSQLFDDIINGRLKFNNIYQVSATDLIANSQQNITDIYFYEKYELAS